MTTIIPFDVFSGLGYIFFMIMMIVIPVGLLILIVGDKGTVGQIALATTLITSIRKTGYDSSSTVLAIRQIIMSTLKKENGLKDFDLIVTHEFEGRYQGMLTTKEGDTIILKIIADRNGGLQWSAVE